MTTTPTPRLIKYAQALESGDPRYYSRYIRDICRLMPDDGSFCDVGCGTGRVLREIYRLRPDAMMAGVEPVPYFRQLAKRSGVPVFADCSHVIGKFDCVGSFAVLGHCWNAYGHLHDCADLVRPGGYLIVACPNMLSPFNNALRLPKSIKRDVFRFYRRVYPAFKVVDKRCTSDQTFTPDDDACVVTHELPVRNSLRHLGLKIISTHGTLRPSIPDPLSRIPFIRWAMPSVYVVARRAA